MKDIKGYEGLYGITSCGKVWSYKSKKFLKPTNDKDGYLRVGLYKDGNSKTYFIHRLVAETFLDNPDNLPCVNHKNEVKTDNYLNNLEWCDHQYNANYGTRNKRISKPVKCIDTGVIYNSITAAAKETDIKICNITLCCQGKQKTAKGYHWEYYKGESEVV